MLDRFRTRARSNVVGQVTVESEAFDIACLVDGRLRQLDPIPRFLVRAGECIAGVPVVGTHLPGGRQYASVVSGLARAFQMEQSERP